MLRLVGGIRAIGGTPPTGREIQQITTPNFKLYKALILSSRNGTGRGEKTGHLFCIGDIITIQFGKNHGPR